LLKFLALHLLISFRIVLLGDKLIEWNDLVKGVAFVQLNDPPYILLNGSSISASIPLVGFGWLNDNAIKGLTSLLSVEQVIYYITYTWYMSFYIMWSVSMVQSQRQTWWCSILCWNEIQLMAYILWDIYGSYENKHIWMGIRDMRSCIWNGLL
jgi:hypothetical protein